MLAGNHDHGIAAGWIDSRLQTEPAGFLGLEERYTPTGALAEQLAEAARPARLQFAYPGLWLREDVYALHGHYADLHATVPTFERIAAGAMAKWVAAMPRERATPDDYEAVLSPLYAWLHALTQRADHTLVSKGGGASSSAYSALTRRTPRALALKTGYRGAVAGLNVARPRPAAGEPVTDGPAPRLPAGHPGGDRAARHRRRARHLGPLAPLRPVAERRRAPSGRAIVNTGSWVYQPHFLSPEPNGSPYWPGTAVLVERRRPAAAPTAPRRPRPRSAQATPGVKHVACTITPASASMTSSPCVWRPWSNRQTQPGSETSSTRSLTRSTPDALDDRPHPARLVRAGVGARLVLGLGRDQHVGSVLGADRRQRLTRHAQQRLDLQLGLHVGALAVVVGVQLALLVPQVARRPALVAVDVPDLEVGVDQHAPRDLQALDGAAHVLRLARRQEPAGVHADDHAGRRRRSARATPSGRAACAAS